MCTELISKNRLDGSMRHESTLDFIYTISFYYSCQYDTYRNVKSKLTEQNFAVTWSWVRWRLKSPASPLFTQPFIQVRIKENIKAPRYWPLCGEFTDDRWIPRTNGQWRGKCFHLMTSSWLAIWHAPHSTESCNCWPHRPLSNSLALWDVI